MALATQRYKLVGFTKELDRRSLHFVEPLPAYRICKACGLVPRMAAFLPCSDVVCKLCYEQCRLNHNFCPLHGQMFKEEDVDWREFTADALLRRQVKCWNEESGCDMVIAASELYEHFFQDCEYHTTSCPKCSAPILCNDVFAHLRSDCADHTLSRMSRAPQASSSDPEAMLIALNTSLDARVGETKDILSEALSESSAQLNNRLNELFLCMNTIKQALLQPSTSEICAGPSHVPEAAAGVASIRAVKQIVNAHGDRPTELLDSISSPSYTPSRTVGDTEMTSLKRPKQNTNNPSMVQTKSSKSVAERTPSLKEISRSLEESDEIQMGTGLDHLTNFTTSENSATNSSSITAPREILEQEQQQTQLDREEDAESTGNTKRCQLTVRALNSMRKFAEVNGSFDYVGEKIYLSGYHMLAGVKLIKRDGSVTMHARIKLIKGLNDECLHWPFKRNIKVIAVHPSEHQVRHCVNYTFLSISHFGKPGPFGNTPLYFAESSLCLEDLEREGYTVDDKVQLAWELA
ncbi:uncharacterized protein LOC142563913 [Dermacentor variabilis]|uniref:uncharacterized protein LOC142563913 n=1 Tax=Dermacentor variabilis TaxID=34621 RepID=UPI003F5B32C4